MVITKDQIVEAVASMSVMEVLELISAIEEKFGVSASIANTAVVSANTIETNEIDKEKTEFNVVLKSIGANKISVIKTVRSAISLGLKEAKELVESSPVTLKEGMSKHDAEILKKSLEEVGAEIEIT